VTVPGCRFHRWLKAGVPLKPLNQWLEEELPPIDVLMVWHAYLLNPLYVTVHTCGSLNDIDVDIQYLCRWYGEDCTRIALIKPLNKLQNYLISAVVSALALLQQ
jgi:hypothetical protein